MRIYSVKVNNVAMETECGSLVDVEMFIQIACENDLRITWNVCSILAFQVRVFLKFSPVNVGIHGQYWLPQLLKQSEVPINDKFIIGFTN